MKPLAHAAHFNMEKSALGVCSFGYCGNMEKFRGAFLEVFKSSVEAL